MHPAFRRCPGHLPSRHIFAFISGGTSFHCSRSSLVRCFDAIPISALLLVGPSGPSNGFVSVRNVHGLTS